MFSIQNDRFVIKVCMFHWKKPLVELFLNVVIRAGPGKITNRVFFEPSVVFFCRKKTFCDQLGFPEGIFFGKRLELGILGHFCGGQKD